MLKMKVYITYNVLKKFKMIYRSNMKVLYSMLEEDYIDVAFSNNYLREYIICPKCWEAKLDENCYCHSCCCTTPLRYKSFFEVAPQTDIR